MTTTISGITKNLSISDFTVKNGNVYINKSFLNGNPGIVLIWGDFCSHCHRFIPTYQELSGKLNKNSTNFACLAIENGELNKDSKITAALNFQGFPTTKFVDQNGKVLGDYNGARDLNSLQDTVCKVYHHCVLNH
jgi:thiol-disulfide isomerase/thioredoxin